VPLAVVQDPNGTTPARPSPDYTVARCESNVPFRAVEDAGRLTGVRAVGICTTASGTSTALIAASCSAVSVAVTLGPARSDRQRKKTAC